MSLLTIISSLPSSSPEGSSAGDGSGGTGGTSYALTNLIADDTTAPFPKVDGNGLVSFDSKLRHMGGWNPPLFSPNYDTNEEWTSPDGLTWTSQGNAAWLPSHSFGHGVLGGYVWKFGGDALAGPYQKDVYKFNAVDGWQLVTNNWGSVAGNRLLFGFCVHKTYLYMVAGQDTYGSAATPFSDIIRSTDGLTWTSIGTLPATWLSTCAVISDGTNLYLIGGGRYNSVSGHSDYNDKVYKSTDDGETWAAVSTQTAFLSMYPNGCYWDGNLWYLMGAYGGANVSGLYYSGDGGVTWTLLNNSYPARHATGITVHNDNLYFVCGNLHNDVWKVEKVAL